MRGNASLFGRFLWKNSSVQEWNHVEMWKTIQRVPQISGAPGWFFGIQLWEIL